jgi:hypothetical protein
MDRWIRVRDDSDDEAWGGLILILLGIALVLSPGVFLATLINYVIPISTTGALWWTAVVASIVVFVICCILAKENFLSTYVIIAVVVTVLIVVISLCDSNNIFLAMVKRMIGWGA